MTKKYGRGRRTHSGSSGMNRLRYSSKVKEQNFVEQFTKRLGLHKRVYCGLADNNSIERIADLAQELNLSIFEVESDIKGQVDIGFIKLIATVPDLIPVYQVTEQGSKFYNSNPNQQQNMLRH